jgi:hypothetical protein
MRQHPCLSAAAPLMPWQKRAMFAVSIVVAAGLWKNPDITAAAIMTLLTPAFLCVAVMRAFAIHQVLNAPALPPRLPPPVQPDFDWPVYSILIPLYREAHMVASIVSALERLDWPIDKRDILFITEADDTATRIALQTEFHGRAGMRIVTVPPGSPRTKPRALMYALPLATGAFVVVYDAEDDPEPGQLLEAYVRFAEAGPDLGCLQARLNIYNANKSWTTRQFTLEYSAPAGSKAGCRHRWSTCASPFACFPIWAPAASSASTFSWAALSYPRSCTRSSTSMRFGSLAPAIFRSGRHTDGKR